MNRGTLYVEEPTQDGSGVVRTPAPSIRFAGSAFVSPADVDCVTVFPIQLTLTWRNQTNGQSGRGGIGSSCVTVPILGLIWNSRWSIPAGVIDLQMGINRVSVTVSDGRGSAATITIPVERLDDDFPPAITSRAPAPGAVDVPVNRSLSVGFSEAMLPSSLTGARFSVQDSAGAPVTGSLSYDQNNFVWRFDPGVDLIYSSLYTVTIGGGVEDRYGGNLLGADDSWSFTTAANPDATPPQVSRVSPEPDTECVAPDAFVVAGFDEPLDSTTVDSTTFQLRDDAGRLVSAAVGYDGITASLYPDLPLLLDERYDATLTTGIADLAGNPLAADFSWSFQTGTDLPLGTWTPTSLTNAPEARRSHTAVWTGTEMIVFGGYGWVQSIGAFADMNSGGRYNPAADVWTATSTATVPALVDHTAIWTGTEMIVWGGNTGSGARYDPAGDSWLPTSTTGAPTARREHAAVWTGTEMIVWGGQTIGGSGLNTGGRYDPSTDTWRAMSTLGAPSPRVRMAAVWTGSELVVWGGVASLADGPFLTDGARYEPIMDTWTPISATDARSGTDLAGFWTGSEVLVWDGGLITTVDSNGFAVHESTLRLYEPQSDTWRATTNACEPYMGASGFHRHWTGTRLFVWSDATWGGYFFDPATDSWQAISTSATPPARSEGASVWAGTRFVMWGGQEPSGLKDTGFVFSE